MDFQTYLKKHGVSCYELHKRSGVPKTTILDISSGKSDICHCDAITVYQIATALKCSIEDLLILDRPSAHKEADQYLELGLPEYLMESLEAMQKAWLKVDHHVQYFRWDIDYCSLQADINCAEVDQLITRDQAQYLRRKYLRMQEREGDEHGNGLY